MSNRPPFPEQEQQPKRQRLTDDEYRVLKECNQESFFQRCLPMSLGAMIGTQVMVNKGIWRAHPKYGSLVKLCGAGLVGYIAGKASYQQKCREKILALDNSPLADAFRLNRPDLMPDLRRSGKQSYSEEPTIISPPTASEIERSATYKGTREDYISTGSINDEQNNQYSGLSDQYRPNIDGDNTHADHSLTTPPTSSSSPASVPGTSYADLQQRNRDEYAARMATAMPRPHPQAPPTSDHHLAPREQKPPTPVQRVKRNQFGDIIED